MHRAKCFSKTYQYIPDPLNSTKYGYVMILVSLISRKIISQDCFTFWAFYYYCGEHSSCSSPLVFPTVFYASLYLEHLLYTLDHRLYSVWHHQKDAVIFKNLVPEIVWEILFWNYYQLDYTPSNFSVWTMMIHGVR